MTDASKHHNVRSQDIRPHCGEGVDWVFEQHISCISKNSIPSEHAYTLQTNEEHSRTCGKHTSSRDDAYLNIWRFGIDLNIYGWNRILEHNEQIGIFSTGKCDL